MKRRGRFKTGDNTLDLDRYFEKVVIVLLDTKNYTKKQGTDNKVGHELLQFPFFFCSHFEGKWNNNIKQEKKD